MITRELLKIRHSRVHQLTADSSFIQSSKSTEESIWMSNPNKKDKKSHTATDFSFWFNNYQLLWGTLQAT